jgi:hypothetical protein
LVRVRFRNPNRRLRRLFDGWYVLFIHSFSVEFSPTSERGIIATRPGLSRNAPATQNFPELGFEVASGTSFFFFRPAHPTQVA